MPLFERATGAIAILGHEWVDDGGRLAYQDCSRAQIVDGIATCQIVTALPDGSALIELARHNSGLVTAGGGVVAWLRNEDRTVYDTLGRSWPGAGLSARGVGPDGAIALKVVRDSYGPWDVLERDGRRWRLADGDAHTIQLLGDGRAYYMIGDVDYVAGEVPFRMPRERHYGCRLAWVPPLARFVGLYQRALDGALVCDDRIVANPSDRYFYPDVEYRADRIRITWSPNQSDTNPQVLELSLDRLAACPLSADVVPPLEVPTFLFSHPVLVRPFKAAGSGMPDIFTLGAYSESPGLPGTLPPGRFVLAHDGQSDWTVPAGLRPWDLALIECYLDPLETIAQSAARWTRQAVALVRQWLGDCGVIPMFYCQGGAPPDERWTVEQVLDGLRALSGIVAVSPRIKVIAPFAYNRANGIVAHPELQAAFANLLAAARAAGDAVLVSPPVPTPPTPPTPPKPPVPPAVSEWSLIMLFASLDGAKAVPYLSLKPSAQAGCVNVILPDGRVLSAHGDDRDPGTDGPWEQGQIAGPGVITYRAAGEYFTHLIVPVDKLPA